MNLRVLEYLMLWFCYRVNNNKEDVCMCVQRGWVQGLGLGAKGTEKTGTINKRRRKRLFLPTWLCINVNACRDALLRKCTFTQLNVKKESYSNEAPKEVNFQWQTPAGKQESSTACPYLRVEAHNQQSHKPGESHADLRWIIRCANWPA